MALNGATIWEVRTGGSDTAAGGGFNPNNANFPTDGTVDAGTGNTASPVFSSASYSFVAGDVGAWVYVKSGTNTLPGWYQIASVASGKATLSAAVGAAVRQVGNSPNYLNTAAGIATTGTPTGITWGLDYSQQNAARVSFTDMVIDGTTNTKFTSAANPVGKNYVGNIIRVTGGTGFTTQYVEVVSTSGTTATCDKSLGTLSSTGGTGSLGGAFASLAPFTSTAPELTAGFKVFIAPGTYSHTVQPLLRTNCYLIGYDTLRTTVPATRPILRSTFAGGLIGIEPASPYVVMLMNLDLDGQSSNVTTALSRVGGVNQLEPALYNCIVRRMTGNGVAGVGSPHVTIQGCLVHSNGGHGVLADSSIVDTFASVFRDNTGDGIGGNSSGGIIAAKSCVFARNARGLSAYTISVENCLFHSNTSSAIGSSLITGFSSSNYMRNLILWGNSGWGIQNSSSTYPGGLSAANGYVAPSFLQAATFGYIAAGNNTSGAIQNLPNPVGFVTLTADPCVDAANNDFSLNLAAGGGALCRAAGFPGAFPGGTTTGYLDIGAAQHYEPTDAEVAAAVWSYPDRTTTA